MYDDNDYYGDGGGDGDEDDDGDGVGDANIFFITPNILTRVQDWTRGHPAEKPGSGPSTLFIFLWIGY